MTARKWSEQPELSLLNSSDEFLVSDSLDPSPATKQKRVAVSVLDSRVNLLAINALEKTNSESSWSMAGGTNIAEKKVVTVLENAFLDQDYRKSATTEFAGIKINDITAKTSNSAININSPLKINQQHLEIKNGVNDSGLGIAAVFSLKNDGGFKHFFKTRHATSPADNRFEIWLNSSSSSAGSTEPGTGNTLALTLDGRGRAGIGNISVAQSILDVSGDISLRNTAKPALPSVNSGKIYYSGKKFYAYNEDNVEREIAPQNLGVADTPEFNGINVDSINKKTADGFLRILAPKLRLSVASDNRPDFWGPLVHTGLTEFARFTKPSQGGVSNAVYGSILFGNTDGLLGGERGTLAFAVSRSWAAQPTEALRIHGGSAHEIFVNGRLGVGVPLPGPSEYVLRGAIDIGGGINFRSITKPGTPNENNVLLYANGNNLYWLNNSGVAKQIGEAGEGPSTTDDLPEGILPDRRYFTDSRADARANIRISASQGVPNGIPALDGSSVILNAHVCKRGTFTPELWDAASEATSYTDREGRYVKIGNFVMFTVLMKVPHSSIPSMHALMIKGLPYSAVNTISNDTDWTCHVYSDNGLNLASGFTPVGIFYPGGKTVYLWKQNAAGQSNNLKKADFSGDVYMTITGFYETNEQ